MSQFEKHLPAFIARSLLHLVRLEIIDCGMLEEIVAKERGGETSTVKFVFPQLASLALKNLPTLTNFYPGVHRLECPVLEQLAVYACGKAKVFASEFLNFQETSDEGQLDIQARQPFFLPEKIIPNLETLGLSSEELGQLPGDLFHELKGLGIKDDKSDFFRPGLLEKFCNLEHLVLRHGSYKELFSCGDVEKNLGSFSRIKTLELFELSDLKHMWKQESKLNSVLQNLIILVVEYCDSLINLVPSSASLQNLTTLKVCYCKEVINLVTPSTAKSLEHLREMSIEGCKRMTEIVANEGDIAEDKLVFYKLEELSLVDLDSLTSFCSANYTFEFPSLEILIVRECPKMKIFCEGDLRTPKLEMVCQNKEDWGLDGDYWEGDLNETFTIAT